MILWERHATVFVGLADDAALVLLLEVRADVQILSSPATLEIRLIRRPSHEVSAAGRGSALDPALEQVS